MCSLNSSPFQVYRPTLFLMLYSHVNIFCSEFYGKLHSYHFSIQQLKHHTAELIDHSQQCEREINFTQDGAKDGISLQIASRCLCGWREELFTSSTALEYLRLGISCSSNLSILYYHSNQSSLDSLTLKLNLVCYGPLDRTMVLT